MGSPEPVRTPGRLDPSMLPESEPARVGLQTVRAMVSAVWPALLPTFSFLLTPNLSDPLFGDVPRRAAEMMTWSLFVVLA